MVPTILLLLLVLVLITAGAAAVLAISSLLSHVFAVSHFEATVTLLVMAALLVYGITRSASLSEDADGEVLAEPTVILSALPLPPRRVRRKRDH